MFGLKFGQIKKGGGIVQVKKAGTDEEKLAAVGIEEPLAVTGNTTPDSAVLVDGQGAAMPTEEDPLAGVRQKREITEEHKKALKELFLKEGFSAEAADLEIERIIDMTKDETMVPPEVDYILQLAHSSFQFYKMIDDVMTSMEYSRGKRQETLRTFLRFGTMPEDVFNRMRVVVRKHLLTQQRAAMAALEKEEGARV